MSAKTTKTTTARTSRASRPARQPRTGTGTPGPQPAEARTGATRNDRVRAALAAAADQTVDALASATGLSKSTVSKALADLEQFGHALRRAGSGAGPRKADLWNPTPASTGTNSNKPTKPAAATRR